MQQFIVRIRDLSGMQVRLLEAEKKGVITEQQRRFEKLLLEANATVKVPHSSWFRESYMTASVVVAAAVSTRQ